MSRQYQVALSFAGEQRDYVEQVARQLRSRSIDVFYDRFKQVDLWGKSGTEVFHSIFGNQSAYVVMFISQAYVEKAWPTLERRSALSRMVQEQHECILPVRFDSTPCPGLPDDTIYIEAEQCDPAELAAMIAEKVLGEVAAVPSSVVSSVESYPYDRANKYLLDRSGWGPDGRLRDDLHEGWSMYFRKYPEFTVGDVREANRVDWGESWCRAATNPQDAHVLSVAVRYHQTELFRVCCISYDGGRTVIPAPEETGFVGERYGDKPPAFDRLWFYSLVMDTEKGNLLQFLLPERSREDIVRHGIFDRVWRIPVAVFESPEEKDGFLAYLEKAPISEEDMASSRGVFERVHEDDDRQDREVELVKYGHSVLDRLDRWRDGREEDGGQEAEIQRINDSTGFLFAHCLSSDGSMVHGFVEEGAEEGDTVEWCGEVHADSLTPARVLRKRTGPRDGEYQPIKQVESVAEALTSGESVGHGVTISELPFEKLLE